MRKLIFAAAILFAAFQPRAQVIVTEAGNLHEVATDVTATSLTLSGTVDARDFRYIYDNFTQLERIDLSGVEIVAYENIGNPVFGSVQSYEAHAIPTFSFFGMNRLQEVVFPAVLTKICFGAFAGCTSMTSVTLPAGVTTIEGYAFSGAGLTSIVLPSAVSRLGERAFYRCEALTSATVPAGEIGDYAFNACASLTTVTLGKDVTVIGANAFSATPSLAAMTMPAESALTAIGNEAFAQSGITALDLTPCTALKSIGDWALARTPITLLQVPASVTTIGKGLLMNTPELQGVQLPLLTHVPDYALACSAMQVDETVLQDGIGSIGDYALYNSDQTVTLEVPASVEHIGERAMAGMTALEQIETLATTVPTLGDDVWSGINQSEVKLGTPDNSIADLYAEAPQWQDFYILRNYLLGDANIDDEINVTDISTTIAFILDNNPERFCRQAADTNGDNDINVSDLSGIVSLIFSDERTIIRRLRSMRDVSAPEAVVTLPDFTLKAGETRTVEVSAESANQLVAMQADLTLPADVTLVGATSPTHKVVADVTEGGVTRLVAFSMQNEAFSPDAPALTLTLHAGNDVEVASTMLLSDIALTDAELNTLHAPDCAAMVSAPTAVEGITLNGARVYTTRGTLHIVAPNAGKAQLALINGAATTLRLEAGHNTFTVDAGVYIITINGESHKVIVE